MRYYLGTFIPVTAVTFLIILLSFIPKQTGIGTVKISFVEIAIGIIISSILLIVMFTKFNSFAIRVIYGLILTISGFTVIGYLSQYADNWFILFILIVLTFMQGLFLTVYIRGIPNVPIRNYGIIITSAIISWQVGDILEFETLVLASIMFSIFDIYSVFYGPLAKVLGKPHRINFRIPSDTVIRRSIEATCKKGTPVYISKFSALGIGDTVFFGLLLYKSLVLWGIMALVFTYIAILLGTINTLFLLKKVSPLPALPIPILSALIIFVIYYLNF